MGLKEILGTKLEKQSNKMLCRTLRRQLEMAKRQQQSAGNGEDWRHLTPEERFVVGRLLGYKIALLTNLLQVGNQSDKFSKEYYLYNYKVDVIEEKLQTILYRKEEPYVYYELPKEFQVLKEMFEKARKIYAVEMERKMILLERSYDAREMTFAHCEKSGLNLSKYEEVFGRLYEGNVLNLELADAYLDYCLEKMDALEVTDAEFGNEFFKWNWKIANVINRIEAQYQQGE